MTEEEMYQDAQALVNTISLLNDHLSTMMLDILEGEVPPVYFIRGAANALLDQLEITLKSAGLPLDVEIPEDRLDNDLGVYLNKLRNPCEDCADMGCPENTRGTLQ